MPPSRPEPNLLSGFAGRFEGNQLTRCFMQAVNAGTTRPSTTVV
jgi:hypothetical protein